MKTPTEQETERWEKLTQEHRTVRTILRQYESLSPANREYVYKLIKQNVEADAERR